MAMYLLWEGATPPDGWTLDASHDDRLLKIGDTYEDGGEDCKHMVSYGAGGNRCNADYCYPVGCSNAAEDLHTHASSYTDVSLPSYRTARLIKSDSFFHDPLPTGVIGFSKAILNNWQAASEYEGRFIQLKNQSPTNGGSNTHPHTPPAQTGGCQQNGRGRKGSQPNASTGHPHNVTGTIDSVETEPEWFGMKIIKSITEAEMPNGLIAMFDAAPDDPGWERGWRVLNGISAYLKVATYHNTGGAPNHTHPHAMSMGGAIGTVRIDCGGIWHSGWSHTSHQSHAHPITIHSANNTPPCAQFIFAEYRDEEVVLLPMYGSKSYTPIRTEDVQVGDKVRLYPYNGGGKVAIKEYWQTGDQITIKKDDI